MKPAQLSTVLVVVATLASPLAVAQRRTEAEKPPDKILTLGNGAANGEQLSRDQLRDCLAMPQRLQTEGDKAKRAASDAEENKAEFDRFDEQLKTERSKVDPKDRAAIAAYNAKLAKREKMVAAYNAKSAAAAERVDGYNGLRKTWESGCENRPYLESDYAVLRPVKSANADEPAKTVLRPVLPEGAASDPAK